MNNCLLFQHLGTTKPVQLVPTNVTLVLGSHVTPVQRNVLATQMVKLIDLKSVNAQIRSY